LRDPTGELFRFDKPFPEGEALSERATTVIVLYAISAVLFTLNVFYYIYGGQGYVGRDYSVYGWMMFLGSIGAGTFVGGTATIIYSLWENSSGISVLLNRMAASIGSLFNFIGKVAFGIWGITITSGLAYIYYLYVVQHALFK
jgi:hypothetical protein